MHNQLFLQRGGWSPLTSWFEDNFNHNTGLSADEAAIFIFVVCLASTSEVPSLLNYLTDFVGRPQQFDSSCIFDLILWHGKESLELVTRSSLLKARSRDGLFWTIQSSIDLIVNILSRSWKMVFLI